MMSIRRRLIRIATQGAQSTIVLKRYSREKMNETQKIPDSPHSLAWAILKRRMTLLKSLSRSES